MEVGCLMDSQKILYDCGNYDKSDEKITPAYAVKPLLKYIPKGWVVWCPCDEPSSQYVKLITANGNKVIHSHIFEGKDFFEYEPEEHYDCIITNIPFKRKRLFVERALDLDKPFAILLTLASFNDKYPIFSFYERNKQPQLLKFNKRIHFTDVNGNVEKKTTFQSGYIGWNLFPKDFIIEELDA